MPDLSHRVRAAIEETIRIARNATPGPWAYHSSRYRVVALPKELGVATQRDYHGPLLDSDGVHIAHNDPEATLRRCEADLRTLDRHQAGYPGEVEYSYHWEKAQPSGEMVEVRNVEPDEPYYCETCGEFWPCPEFSDRAAAYGVPVEEAT